MSEAGERDGVDEVPNEFGDTAAESDADTPDEGLLSQLAVIEDQPLGDRAAAFAHLHDALRQQLEA